MAKAVCPVTRKEFFDNAKPVAISVEGQNGVFGLPKTFSTQSIGWYATGKVTLQVNGKPVEVQVGGNFTVIGSKELPK